MHQHQRAEEDVERMGQCWWEAQAGDQRAAVRPHGQHKQLPQHGGKAQQAHNAHVLRVGRKRRWGAQLGGDAPCNSIATAAAGTQGCVPVANESNGQGVQPIVRCYHQPYSIHMCACAAAISQRT